MFKKISRANLFAQIFNFGLLLLFAGLLKEYFFASAQTDYFQFGLFSFFAASVTVCLVSLIFLFIEWMMIPFGTQGKRHALYRGAGNLFALVMLGGAYLLIAEQSPPNLSRILPFSLGSGAIFVAAIFAFLGNSIANRICCKKIKLKTLTARNLPNRLETTATSNNNGGNVRPLKIQKFLSEIR